MCRKIPKCRGWLISLATFCAGGFVLAQDPQTGELDYKVVLAIASPRNLAISMIELERGALHCASGQVVWTAGHGWRRYHDSCEKKDSPIAQAQGLQPLGFVARIELFCEKHWSTNKELRCLPTSSGPWPIWFISH